MGNALLPYTVWRHRKGGRYTVLALATDSETGADVVVYLDQHGKAWVRGKADFLERCATDAEAADYVAGAT